MSTTSSCRACCIWPSCARPTPTRTSSRSISSAAQAAPGVHLAFSGADLAGKMGPIVPNWILPGTKVPVRPVVAVDRVRFVGECVALVVADTQADGLRRASA